MSTPTTIVRASRSRGDQTASVLILVTSVIGWAAGSFFIFFVVGLFGGDCITADCGAYAGVAAEKIAIAIAAGIVFVGVVVTLARIVLRRRAWPFALAAFVACGICLAIGGIVFVLDA